MQEEYPQIIERKFHTMRIELLEESQKQRIEFDDLAEAFIDAYECNEKLDKLIEIAEKMITAGKEAQSKGEMFSLMQECVCY